MNMALDIAEKSKADNFFEFIQALTPKEQEKMEIFIQAFIFWKQIEPAPSQPSAS